MKYILAVLCGFWLVVPAEVQAGGAEHNTDVLLATRALKTEALQDDADRLLLEDIEKQSHDCLRGLGAWPQAVAGAADSHARWMAAFTAQTSALLEDATPIDSWSALAAFQERVFEAEQRPHNSEPLRASYRAATDQLVSFGNAASATIARINIVLQWPHERFQDVASLPTDLRATAEILREARESAAHAHVLLTAQLQTRSHLLGQLPAAWNRRLNAASARLQQFGVAGAERDLQRRINNLRVFSSLQSRLMKHDLEVFILHEALLSPLTALRLERQRVIELQDLDNELEVADLDADLEARLSLLMTGAHQGHKASLEALQTAASERARFRQSRSTEVANAPRRAQANAERCERLADQVRDADDLASEEAYQEYVQTCIADS
jgi:hypothetical protein